MDFLDEINEKTVIVCPDTIKNKILNEINKRNRLINVKLYSLEELKKLVYFDYDINTILYLMDNEEYKFSYDIAKYYIDNLYYVDENIKYNNNKLDYLVKIKKDLIDNNLLIINKLFKKSYKDTPFLVFGYDYIDSFDKKLLSNFNYKELPCINSTKNQIVYKFNTLEDEVLFVINKIIELVKNKVDINNIYLLNLDSNYNDEIIRLFNMFNIPIDLNSNSSIISTIVGKDIFNYLKENKSIESCVEYMKSIDLYNKDQLLYTSILNIFNKHVGLEYSFDSILDSIKHDFENTKINNDILKNSVKIGDLYNSYYNDDDYVFLLGFNQGSIPKVFKDEDYINDELKPKLGLDLTSKINKERITATVNNINKIKNIIITYKKHYMKEEFYPSNLLSLNSFIEEEGEKISTENSLIYSQLYLAKMYDNLINYDEKNEDFSKYSNSLNDIRYMDFDNRYKMIDKSLLISHFNNPLILSYTSLNTFFKCQFRYYIEDVLGLNIFEDSFDANIGTLFHLVLSKIDSKDFDLDKIYNNYISKKPFSNKELFYFEKLKKELIIICDYVKKFHSNTRLNNILTERDILIDKSKDKVNITFKGKVDKIMSLSKNGKTLVSVIDYKTGNDKIELDYVNCGIGLQLFIYLYLISNSDLFNNPYFVGFYLQNIINEIKIDPKKSFLDQKIDELKLRGYSIDDRDALEEFDPTYRSSEYIKSMSITAKDNFDYNSKVLNEDTMKKIINFVDKKVDDARDKIIDGDFEINPKQFNGEDDILGCSYCRFKDICFMKNEDIKYFDKNNKFDFLEEGELNA